MNGEKVFIIIKRERTARGICKSPGQREKETDRSRPELEKCVWKNNVGYKGHKQLRGGETVK